MTGRRRAERSSTYLFDAPAPLAAVDRWAQRRMSSRAQVMREAAADYLRRQGALDGEPELTEAAV